MRFCKYETSAGTCGAPVFSIVDKTQESKRVKQVRSKKETSFTYVYPTVEDYRCLCFFHRKVKDGLCFP